MLEANILQLETGGVTIRDSTINFNTGKRYTRVCSVVKRGRLIDRR